MDEKIEDAKGRAKEVVGSLTGNEDLKDEGKADQASASLKDKFGDIVDSVRDTIGNLKKK